MVNVFFNSHVTESWGTKQPGLKVSVTFDWTVYHHPCYLPFPDSSLDRAFRNMGRTETPSGFREGCLNTNNPPTQ